MSVELLPCPFCGGAARIESNRDWHKLFASHDDDCVFDADDHDLMYPAQPGYLIEIAEAWNRRAPLPAEQPSNQVSLTVRELVALAVSHHIRFPLNRNLIAFAYGLGARIVGQQTNSEGK